MRPLHLELAYTGGELVEFALAQFLPEVLGPVPALLQNSEIDLFTHSPFASRPLTHSHGAPFGGALRAR